MINNNIFVAVVLPACLTRWRRKRRKKHKNWLTFACLLLFDPLPFPHIPMDPLPLLLQLAPPQWLVEPRDSQVVLHQSTRIDCLASGSPKPFTTWKRATGKCCEKYYFFQCLCCACLKHIPFIWFQKQRFIFVRLWNCIKIEWKRKMEWCRIDICSLLLLKQGPRRRAQIKSTIIAFAPMLDVDASINWIPTLRRQQSRIENCPFTISLWTSWPDFDGAFLLCVQ